MYNDGMNKMPFYPFYNYDSSDKMDNDYFYMQSITPYGMSDITKHIIDECDRLEYDGSFMFDEYPDKNRMLAITKKIAKNTSSEKSMENMIFQALANEMIHRRRRHRCCKNWNRKCFY